MTESWPPLWVKYCGLAVINFLGVSNMNNFGLIFSFIEWTEVVADDQDPSLVSGLLSWVPAVFLGVSFGGGLIATLFAKKFGIKNTMYAGTCFLTAGFAGTFFATNFFVILFFVAFLQGVGLAPYFTLSMVVVQCWFDEKSRVLASALLTLCVSIGSIVMAWIHIHLNEIYGWRGLILLDCGFALNLFVSVYVSFGGQPSIPTAPSNKANDNEPDFHHVDLTAERYQEKLYDSLIFLPAPPTSVISLDKLGPRELMINKPQHEVSKNCYRAELASVLLVSFTWQAGQGAFQSYLPELAAHSTSDRKAYAIMAWNIGMVTSRIVLVLLTVLPNPVGRHISLHPMFYQVLMNTLFVLPVVLISFAESLSASYGVEIFAFIQGSLYSVGCTLNPPGFAQWRGIEAVSDLFTFFITGSWGMLLGTVIVGYTKPYYGLTTALTVVSLPGLLSTAIPWFHWIRFIREPKKMTSQS